MKVVLFVGLLCAVTYEITSKIIKQECSNTPLEWKPRSYVCDADCTRITVSGFECIWERNFTSPTSFEWCQLEEVDDYCHIKNTICNPDLNYWWKCNEDCYPTNDPVICDADAEARFNSYK